MKLGSSIVTTAAAPSGARRNAGGSVPWRNAGVYQGCTTGQRGDRVGYFDVFWGVLEAIGHCFLACLCG